MDAAAVEVDEVTITRILLLSFSDLNEYSFARNFQQCTYVLSTNIPIVVTLKMNNCLRLFIRENQNWVTFEDLIDFGAFLLEFASAFVLLSTFRIIIITSEKLDIADLRINNLRKIPRSEGFEDSKLYSLPSSLSLIKVQILLLRKWLKEYSKKITTRKVKTRW